MTSLLSRSPSLSGRSVEVGPQDPYSILPLWVTPLEERSSKEIDDATWNQVGGHIAWPRVWRQTGPAEVLETYPCNLYRPS